MNFENNRIIYTEQDIVPAHASLALEVQDACNLSGVAISFVAIVKELNKHPKSTGTDWVRCHPVSFMFCHKMCSMCGPEDLQDRVFDLYCAATKLLKTVIDQKENK